jgi:hypothetical protein
MAKQTTITVVDDMDGSEASRTIVFSLEDKAYEIDLSAEHDAQLREALEPFIAAARKLGGSARTRNINTARSFGRYSTTTHRPTLAEKHTKDDTDKVREWARANGFQVADRGRLSVKVLTAYDKRDRSQGEQTEADRELVAEHQANVPPLATPEGKQDAEQVANDMLAEDRARKAKAKAGKAAAVVAPTVVADPFKPVRNGKASLRQRHPRAECEDLDACPHHGEVTPITRAGKGKASVPTVGEVDAQIMAWVRENATRPVSLSRAKPTTKEYEKYYAAHPEAKRA